MGGIYRAEGKMKITEIDIEKILEPAAQVRKNISMEGLEELTESIKRLGLIEPIVVKSVGEKYEVIAGHRRLLACRKAELVKVPCIVKEQEETDEEEIKLHENFYRENVNPADEAEFYAYLMNKKGLGAEELGRKVGKSGAYIRERLNLLKGDKLVLEAVKDGQISPTIAKELNLITDDTVRNQYLSFAIESGAKVRTVQEWRKNWEKEERTKEAIQQGVTPEQLPDVLPKYYYKCPMCERPTEISKLRAINLCENCYNYLINEVMKNSQKNELSKPDTR